MIVTEPQVADNGKYPATKAAKALDIHINTLRSKADAGLIRFGVSKSNGRRFFLGSEIKKFWRTA